MGRITKSALVENHRVVKILQNMIAVEKRTLSTYTPDAGGIDWFDYELEKGGLRIQLLNELIGKLALLEKRNE